MKRSVTFSLVFIYLVFSFQNVAFAKDQQVEIKTKVEASHIANVFEKLGEKVTLFFKFSKKDKADYENYLIEKRLSELKYVVDSKQGNLIEETSSRYATYLSSFSDLVIKNKLSNKKNEVLNLYSRHKKILEELQNTFETDSVFRMLIQHDIDTIKLFSTRVKDNL